MPHFKTCSSLFRAAQWRTDRPAADMPDALILFNPDCSKCRATLQLLRERGIEPQIVDYLSHPPSPEIFSRLLDELGLEPRDVLRRDDPDYVALHMDNPALDRDALIALALAHPHLIQRPIVSIGGKAVIARPPETVLALL
jgi:arsenate reductase